MCKEVIVYHFHACKNIRKMPYYRKVLHFVKKMMKNNVRLNGFQELSIEFLIFHQYICAEMSEIHHFFQLQIVTWTVTLCSGELNWNTICKLDRQPSSHTSSSLLEWSSNLLLDWSNHSPLYTSLEVRYWATMLCGGYYIGRIVEYIKVHSL